MPAFRWIAGETPGKLAVIPRPGMRGSLSDSLRELRSDGVDALVSMLGPDESRELGLADEATSCRKSGIAFFNLPIVDRATPADAAEVRELAERLSSLLDAGQNVAVHCRMGIGRSSLMAACVMAFHGIAAGDAFDRISLARGLEVPDTLSQRLWVQQFADSLTMG